jgi:hypothetical protein
MLGITFVVGSAFYGSSFLAILGVSITFYSSILLYIAPTRYVPIGLLNAVAETSSANIERALVEYNFNQKGIYLPPKNLKNVESSLVFIPENSTVRLPKPEEDSKRLINSAKDGIFITPPGLELSLLWERQLGISFISTDLPKMQIILPKLLVEGLELAGKAEIETNGNIITLRVTKSILYTICQETDNQLHVHQQVGCLLSSAIACALAKTTGKPVTIQKETHDTQTETTTIEYKIGEE